MKISILLLLNYSIKTVHDMKSHVSSVLVRLISCIPCIQLYKWRSTTLCSEEPLLGLCPQSSPHRVTLVLNMKYIITVTCSLQTAGAARCTGSPPIRAQEGWRVTNHSSGKLAGANKVKIFPTNRNQHLAAAEGDLKPGLGAGTVLQGSVLR